MGFSEEQAEKVVKSLNENFVAKAKFNEIDEENKALKLSVSERDKQLEEVKKSSGDNAELKKQIEELQAANKKQTEAHAAEMEAYKLNVAIDAAVAKSGAKNVKAVKALLKDLDSAILDENGTVSGLSEQLEALKKSDGYMFAESTPVPMFTGFVPGNASSVPSSQGAAYESKLAEARKNNDRLGVIKVKQEAAANGVVLN